VTANSRRGRPSVWRPIIERALSSGDPGIPRHYPSREIARATAGWFNAEIRRCMPNQHRLRFQAQGAAVVLIQGNPWECRRDSHEVTRATPALETNPPKPPGAWTDPDASLDRETRARSRVEQTWLRAWLLKGRPSAPCAVCGSILPDDLLVCAHILPRSNAGGAQRRERANIMLACGGCDVLFENGYIVVEEGRVAVREGSGATEDLRRLLVPLNRRPCSAWGIESAPYFAAHAKRHSRRRR
jgi:hypothetical protein